MICNNFKVVFIAIVNSALLMAKFILSELGSGATKTGFASLIFTFKFIFTNIMKSNKINQVWLSGIILPEKLNVQQNTD